MTPRSLAPVLAIFIDKSAAVSASSRNAVRRLDDVRERTVRAFGVEFDGPGRVDVGGANFSGPVLEALGHHNLNSMRGARHRILDRLDLGLQHTPGDETGDSSIPVE
jgi:hypothetical protein